MLILSDSFLKLICVLVLLQNADGMSSYKLCHSISVHAFHSLLGCISIQRVVAFGVNSSDQQLPPETARE